MAQPDNVDASAANGFPFTKLKGKHVDPSGENRLEVANPLILSWQEISVFVKGAPCCELFAISYPRPGDVRAYRAGSYEDDVVRSSPLDRSCEVDEILIGNGWNDQQGAGGGGERTPEVGEWGEDGKDDNGDVDSRRSLEKTQSSSQPLTEDLKPDQVEAIIIDPNMNENHHASSNAELNASTLNDIAFEGENEIPLLLLLPNEATSVVFSCVNQAKCHDLDLQHQRYSSAEPEASSAGIETTRRCCLVGDRKCAEEVEKKTLDKVETASDQAPEGAKLHKHDRRCQRKRRHRHEHRCRERRSGWVKEDSRIKPEVGSRHHKLQPIGVRAQGSLCGARKLEEQETGKLQPIVGTQGFVCGARQQTAQEGGDEDCWGVQNQNQNHPRPSDPDDVTETPQPCELGSSPASTPDPARGHSPPRSPPTRPSPSGWLSALIRSTRSGLGLEPATVTSPSPDQSAGVDRPSLPRGSWVSGPMLGQAYIDRRRRSMVQWKPLLRHVTALACPGEVVVVLGAGGAGKSLLLNVLACRPITGGHVSGTLRVNGSAVKGGLGRVMAFVPQRDQRDGFVTSLTVLETLTFRAMLDLGTMSAGRRRRRVLSVLCIVHLLGSAHKVVGSPDAGLTLAEDRLLSLALELIRNPPMVLCDDLTAGLDLFEEQQVMSILQLLAGRDHTVVCSTGRPSSFTLAGSHKLLLLEEGRQAFFGTTLEATDFFCSLGHPRPDIFSPPDFFLHIVHVKAAAANHDASKSRASDAYPHTGQAQEVWERVTALRGYAKTRGLHTGKRPPLQCSGHPAFFSRRLHAQLWRHGLCLRRDRVRFHAAFLLTVLHSVAIGAVFFSLNGAAKRKGGSRADGQGVFSSCEDYVHAVNSALFVVSACCGVAPVFSALALVQPWVVVMAAERERHGIGPAASYLVLSVLELPLTSLLSAVFLSLDYWMLGLASTPAGLALATGVAALSATAGAGLGHLLSAAVGDAAVGRLLAALVVLPLLLTAGFFTKAAALPAWLAWLRHVSWFRHAFHLLTVNQWRDADRHSVCPGGACSGGNGTTCDFSSGSDVLRRLDFSADGDLLSYLLLASLLIAFRLLAFACLTLRTRPS